MTVYNVKVSIVELIDETDRSSAITNLVDRLSAAGFDVYEPDAFESENQA